ncbi:hypothetical protein [Nocardiopsis ansamitocini]|uniref:wHTH-Hsp90 Na associated domain-containing protein n=1 Tax=Nocardiopsis ansamitocini TaxID=1670832 RepID=A0A9W6ULW8_9ACTN|nr:hypothetical protein [Nocardiopsis ansamitocini]GLU50480.1 hypothetical protein Nans01_48310 [Nocardiopsis ansamitocini]
MSDLFEPDDCGDLDDTGCIPVGGFSAFSVTTEHVSSSPFRKPGGVEFPQTNGAVPLADALPQEFSSALPGTGADISPALPAMEMEKGGFLPFERSEMSAFVEAVPPLPVEPGPDDYLMVSRDLDPDGPSLDAAEPVPLPHILWAAHRTEQSPAQVRDRLAELGFTRVPQGYLPAVADPDDLLVASRDLDGCAPWLATDEPVPLIRVLRTAEAMNRTPEHVRDRLADLGYTRTPQGALPAAVHPEDLLMASRDLNGRAPWLNVGKKVPFRHVLQAASATGRPPADTVARLETLGYPDVELPRTPLPATVGAHDVGMVDVGELNVPPLTVDAPVPLPHILRTAERLERGPADVARRLTELGYPVEGAHALPGALLPGDLDLLRDGFWGQWLDRADEVGAAHVLAVAERTARQGGPHAVATRLVELGYRLPYVPEARDTLLLSRALDGDGPWFGAGDHAGTGHVLRAAQLSGRTPAQVVARLDVLGVTTRNVSLPETPDVHDVLVLSENLDSAPPWLDARDQTRLAHVLAAALATYRNPAQIARRLIDLGHPLHFRARLPASADPHDIGLLRTVEPHLTDPLEAEHILRSADLTGRSPADVASRLTELGYEVREATHPEAGGTPPR